jgi:uncharacterized protein YkwD
VRELERRLGIAIVLLALGACSDADTAQLGGDDGDPVFEDDDTNEAPSAASDGGVARRDSGSPADAGSDAATTSDAGDGEQLPPTSDGGRRRRDASVADATTPTTDAAALPVSDAAIPSGDYCAATASWDPAWTAFEDEVLRLTNEARAVGHNCDAEGNFAATTPLTMEPRLRCAARLYSKEMSDTGNFSHDSLDGTKFDTRIVRAGYKPAGSLGENIAAGQRSPSEVVKGWLDSDGHCANIMAPNFKQIGIGYYKGSGAQSKAYWTQDFAGTNSRN